MAKTFDQVNAVRALITNGENSVEGNASEQILALTAQSPRHSRLSCRWYHMLRQSLL